MSGFAQLSYIRECARSASGQNRGSLAATCQRASTASGGAIQRSRPFADTQEPESRNEKGPNPFGFRASANRAGKAALCASFSLMQRVPRPPPPGRARRRDRSMGAEAPAMARGRQTAGDTHERTWPWLGSVCADDVAWFHGGSLKGGRCGSERSEPRHGANSKDSLLLRQAPRADFSVSRTTHACTSCFTRARKHRNRRHIALVRCEAWSSCWRPSSPAARSNT